VHGSSCCARLASDQQPVSAPPFSARGRAMRFDMRRIDHLRVRGSTVCRKFSEQVLPNPALCPTHKPIIDRHGRPILRRAIAPAASALENMHDPTDNPAIIDPLHTANIRRQMRLDPGPLILAQPKQIPAHHPDPLPKRIRIVWNQDCPASAPQLMSFDPSRIHRSSCAALLRSVLFSILMNRHRLWFIAPR
jgi:hypothetical protein